MALAINPALRRVAAPPIAEAGQWLRATRADLPPLDLAQAVPNYAPAPALLDHLQAAAADPKTALYTPIQGLPALREAQAAALSRDYAAPIAAAETTITTGCNHAFCMATAAVAGAGDEVILPEPFYFNHAMWFSMQGIRQVPLPCRAEAEGMVPDPDEAAALIGPSTRAIALVSPNNPTGTVYSQARLEAFYDLAERHAIALVLDETYKDFRPAVPGVPRPPPHALFRRESWRDVLIQLYSFSKAYSLTGYRVGSLVAGPRVTEAVAKIADTVTICPPHIGQRAALFGLRRLDDWRDGKCAEVERLIAALEAAFAAHPSSYELIARGAFFAYLRHPFPGTSSIEVARTLARDQALLVLPGEFFGASQAGYLRVAFANADAEQLMEMARRLARPA